MATIFECGEGAACRQTCWRRFCFFSVGTLKSFQGATWDQTVSACSREVEFLVLCAGTSLKDGFRMQVPDFIHAGVTSGVQLPSPDKTVRTPSERKLESKFPIWLTECSSQAFFLQPPILELRTHRLSGIRLRSSSSWRLLSSCSARLLSFLSDCIQSNLPPRIQADHETWH